MGANDNEEVMVSAGPAFKPAHPGEILREDILPALERENISVAALARMLKVSRQTLYAVMREKRAVTADMAARLGKVFGNSALFWLNLQARYDAWHAERNPEIAGLDTIAQCA
jgi:addiction module HigA family antidote